MGCENKKMIDGQNWGYGGIDLAGLPQLGYTGYSETRGVSGLIGEFIQSGVFSLVFSGPISEGL